jgi:hypothetical protein
MSQVTGGFGVKKRQLLVSYATYLPYSLGRILFNPASMAASVIALVFFSRLGKSPKVRATASLPLRALTRAWWSLKSTFTTLTIDCWVQLERRMHDKTELTGRVRWSEGRRFASDYGDLKLSRGNQRIEDGPSKVFPYLARHERTN